MFRSFKVVGVVSKLGCVLLENLSHNHRSLFVVIVAIWFQFGLYMLASMWIKWMLDVFASMFESKLHSSVISVDRGSEKSFVGGLGCVEFWGNSLSFFSCADFLGIC